MSNHTPGPWVAKQEFANRWRIESHANGPEFIPISVGIACTTILEVGCADEDTEANARLMAAAPDLLAALKHCLQEHGGFTIKGKTERIALAALAKAEGNP